ncbi:MAG: transposase [Acidobacteria bacterium]|nr:transposase [Acidobacteriota bacterium]
MTAHLAPSRSGDHHRRISHASPEGNGKNERSHKTDQQEFYNHQYFRNRKGFAQKLTRWERKYSERRHRLALEGKTPAERVQGLTQVPPTVKNLS